MLISIARMFLSGVDIHQFVGNKCVVAVVELRGKVGRLESTSRNFINGVTPVGAPTNYADLVSDRISALPLDVDGNDNGFSDALTDGLMCHRLTAGLTGSAVTNGAIGLGASRADWAAIQAFVNPRCGANFWRFHPYFEA